MTKNVQERFKRVIERNNNNPRYNNLTREMIEQAMVDALNTSLPALLGSERQSFYAFWDKDNNIQVKVTRLIDNIKDEDRYYNFNLNLLGEMNIRAILEEFQLYLDYVENKVLFSKIKVLKNNLIYGSVVHYNNDLATIEFYTDDGVPIYAFCHKRFLIEEDRNIINLRKKESVLFYVKNIKLNKDSRLEIELSNRSIHIPELLLKKILQEYGYDLSAYPMKCVYRIPGKFSRLVVLHHVNKGVTAALKEELGGENIHIIAVTDEIDIYQYKKHKISFQELAKKYSNKKKVKIKNKKRVASNNKGDNEVLNTILNKFKGI